MRAEESGAVHFGGDAEGVTVTRSSRGQHLFCALEYMVCRTEARTHSLDIILLIHNLRGLGYDL